MVSHVPLVETRPKSLSSNSRSYDALRFMTKSSIDSRRCLRVELDEQLMSANCRPCGPTELSADSRHCDALSLA